VEAIFIPLSISPSLPSLRTGSKVSVVFLALAELSTEFYSTYDYLEQLFNYCSNNNGILPMSLKNCVTFEKDIK
jgi:hypothetical protein